MANGHMKPHNPLQHLLPKIRYAKEPTDHKKEANVKLREYFKTFYKRSKRGRSLYTPPKFTMFLEPCPYLSVYMEGDDKLPMKKLFFSGFRVAYRQYMTALTKHKKEEAKKRRASQWR
jgi:hypothetical protein